MDPRRDIDLSGNRVVNVADPTEHHHATTKYYVDLVHLLTPRDNAAEYARFISLRRYTQNSLTRLCAIFWNWEWEENQEEEKNPKDTKDVYNLLESEICPTILRITPQQLTTKYITIKYKFAVHVDNWKISITYENPRAQPALAFRYVWQVSNDGINFNSITEPTDVVIRNFPRRRCGNDAEMEFKNENEANVRADYWKILITTGQFVDHFYINQLYMIVTP